MGDKLSITATIGVMVMSGGIVGNALAFTSTSRDYMNIFSSPYFEDLSRSDRHLFVSKVNELYRGKDSWRQYAPFCLVGKKLSGRYELPYSLEDLF